jgi:ferric-dicitrate binding protein FerR (iron transport regulator)
MQNNILIDALLNKFLQGKLTYAERKQMYDMLNDTSNEQAFKDILFRHLSEFTGEMPYYNKGVDFDSMYQNILTSIHQEDDSARKLTIRKVALYAASAAAVFITAFLLGRFIPDSTDKSIKTFVASTYNEVSAPYGSRSEVKLPDGTVVMLNAGSTLRYKSDFNLNNRNISMAGEAYFKVAKNAEIPLIVNVGSINIRAVGTEFNIKAYDEEGTIETTLIEGKVEISSEGGEMKQPLDLVPNQKAIFYKSEESFVLEKTETKPVKPQPVKVTYDNILISPRTDVDQIVAWTEGKMILRGENLFNLCTELERKYDVKIVFRNEEIKNCKFNGVLLDETLEQVLNVLRMTAPINFTLDGKTVYLDSDAGKLNDFLEHMK